MQTFYKKSITHYPYATHSNLTSSPANGASGKALGKLFGKSNFCPLATKKHRK